MLLLLGNFVKKMGNNLVILSNGLFLGRKKAVRCRTASLSLGYVLVKGKWRKRPFPRSR